MVKSIISVRRSSICWRGRRELITDVRKPNHGYDVIVGERAIYWLLRSPSQTCHAKPKTQINRRRTFQLLSRWWDAYRKQLGLKDFSPKSQDAVALQQIKERGATYDWSWWYPSGNRPLQQYLGFTAGRWLWQFERLELTAWLQNSKKRAERSEMMHIDSLPRLSPLWLSASSSACHGLLIITVITPLPTKPSATKMPENWSWRTRQLLTCRCVSVMLLRSMQNTRRS